MAEKRTYRTLDQSEEAYYRAHPEEIDDYLVTVFEEYSKDRCIGSLLSQLRMVARIKGISLLAEETGLSRNGIQKALSQQGNPQFESINTIMNAMGYRFTLQKIDNYIQQ